MDDVKDLSDKVEESIVYVFKVKYHGTKENVAVHEAFKEYCRLQTDNNYLQGIKRLLELASVDWKYESLHEEIIELKNKVVLLEQEKESKKEELLTSKSVIKTFG